MGSLPPRRHCVVEDHLVVPHVKETHFLIHKRFPLGSPRTEPSLWDGEAGLPGVGLFFVIPTIVSASESIQHVGCNTFANMSFFF